MRNISKFKSGLSSDAELGYEKVIESFKVRGGQLAHALIFDDTGFLQLFSKPLNSINPQIRPGQGVGLSLAWNKSDYDQTFWDPQPLPLSSKTLGSYLLVKDASQTHIMLLNTSSMSTT
jgi:hypothetical protein